jgi:hypothetical protein
LNIIGRQTDSRYLQLNLNQDENRLRSAYSFHIPTPAGTPADTTNNADKNHMLDHRHRRLTTTRSFNRQGFLLPLFCAAALLACVSARAVPIDVEAAYTFDDNVTRAQRDSDIFDDKFLSLQVGTSFLQWLNQNNRLIYRGFLRGEFYDEFDKLSNATAGVSATYQYRASGAFTSPTYGAFVKVSITEYDKSELRDSDLLNVGVSFRKPFTDRIVYSAILSFNKRDSESTVFDTSEISLLQNIDYALGERWTMYLTHNYLDGDITSTAVPWLKIVNIADAINADDAFDSGRFAYRLDAKTHVVTVGTNFRVNERNSLDLSVRWVESEATADDVTYERWIVSLAYLTRF